MLRSFSGFTLLYKSDQMADSNKIVQVDVDALSGAVSTAIAQAIRQQPSDPVSADHVEASTRKRRYFFTKNGSF